MDELLEELRNNKNDTIRKDYIIEKLKKINPYYEVAKGEIESAIEDICNDYVDSINKGEKLYNNKEAIKLMACELMDYDIWQDVYDMAREMVFDKLR